MVPSQPYTLQLNLRPALNHPYLDLSGATAARIIIRVGRLPRVCPDYPEHEQAVLVQRKDSILDAYHSLKTGILRLSELGASAKVSEIPHFLDLDLLEAPGCTESTIQLKAGGTGQDRINKQAFQEIEYPINLKNLQGLKADTFYQFVFVPHREPIEPGNIYSGKDVGLNWWKKAGSEEAEKTVPQVRLVGGPVFQAKRIVHQPPKFRYDITIHPSTLSLSKPVLTAFTMNITLVEDETYTVECKNQQGSNLFDNQMSLSSLVVVDSSTDAILSGEQSLIVCGPPIEQVGYRRSGFKEFQPEKTFQKTRKIETDNLEKVFRCELNVDSMESLKNRPLSLRLRTANTMGGVREDVSLWWTRKSIDDLFGKDEVVFSTGDRTYLDCIKLPASISVPFSIVD
jgi:hypothetical protein